MEIIKIGRKPEFFVVKRKDRKKDLYLLRNEGFIFDKPEWSFELDLKCLVNLRHRAEDMINWIQANPKFEDIPMEIVEFELVEKKRENEPIPSVAAQKAA